MKRYIITEKQLDEIVRNLPWECDTERREMLLSLPELPAERSSGNSGQPPAVPEKDKAMRICDIIREHKDDYPENVLHRVAMELRIMGHDVFAPAPVETDTYCDDFCPGCGQPINIKPGRE